MPKIRAKGSSRPKPEVDKRELAAPKQTLGVFKKTRCLTSQVEWVLAVAAANRINLLRWIAVIATR